MDIDTRSPPFRTYRSTSGISKRPRSPPSPSPLDRPNKRLSLGGINSSISSALQVFPVDAPPLRTRQVSEDWVQKTRVLRIDRDEGGPAVTQEPSLPSVVECGHEDRMSMDYDDPMATVSHPAVMSQDARPQQNLTFTLSPYPSSDQQSAYTPTQYSPAFSDAFPSGIPSSLSLQSNVTQESFPPSQDMQIQPEQIPLPTTPMKKQRFTMGPRSDCEKCRLGVPGHYSHLN